MTITEFLDQRLAEDEAAAAAADTGTVWVASKYGDGVCHEGGAQIVVGTYGYMDDGTAEHITRHQPARELREAAAKRAIIAAYHSTDPTLGPDYWIGLDTAISALASAYSGHPDYQADWA